MMRPIVICGAGGHGREVLELLRDINRHAPAWEVLGFLDDDPALWGTTLNDARVLGGRDWLDGRQEPPHLAFGIGSPPRRLALHAALKGRVAGFPTLVHPAAVLSRYVALGEGTQVAAGCVLTANIRIGAFTLLNLGCTVSHDCTVGDHVSIAPGVHLPGNVRIADGCDVGTGACFVPGTSAGEWSVIGAGAAVASDLPANCTAVGVPARVIRTRPPGWQLAAARQEPS